MRKLIRAGQDHKSAALNLVKCELQLLMQRRAQAYLSAAGSLTRCWVQPAYDLCLCNDTEAAEPDKKLRLINWNVWCEIFNTPLSSCSSLGVYGSAWKAFYLFSTCKTTWCWKSPPPTCQYTLKLVQLGRWHRWLLGLLFIKSLPSVQLQIPFDLSVYGNVE